MVFSNEHAFIQHTILVLSGKGGVGKSTVTVQIAQGLARLGKRVGVLDIDICGPSLPKMFGIEKSEVLQTADGWTPVYVKSTPHEIGVMSIGFLLPSPDDAVVWRGPRKFAMIKQFIEDVCWGEIDYLIIDTPPGTSDEHLTICELMKDVVDGAVLVTTPQGVALNDVRKEVDFCEKLQIPILGVIENMSGYVCPHCSNCTAIFGSGGGKVLSDRCGLSLLGTVPIEPRLAEAEDDGRDFTSTQPDSVTAKRFEEIVLKITRAVETTTVQYE